MSRLTRLTRCLPPTKPPGAPLQRDRVGGLPRGSERSRAGSRPRSLRGLGVDSWQNRGWCLLVLVGDQPVEELRRETPFLQTESVELLVQLLFRPPSTP